MAEEPKIRGFSMVAIDRDVAVGDKVLVHLNTPINGLTDVEGEVTKLNANNGTINVDVLNNGTGLLQSVDSVKNFIPQDRSPWFSWPEEAKPESSDRKPARSGKKTS